MSSVADKLSRDFISEQPRRGDSPENIPLTCGIQLLFPLPGGEG
jgi:hypothetical protein